MKTLIALAIFSSFAIGQTPPVSEATKARHFELEIKQVVPGQGALANGTIYDIAPGTKVPPGNVTSNGVAMPRVNQFAKPVGQVIFIRGVSNIADNDDWEGMLEPDGTFSYRTVAGAAKTVHAYKLSSAPDPVAAWWKSQPAPKKQFPPTALDKK